jgi:hypothetical protein
MKRMKKILKWTGIALGVLLAILLVANAVFVWITDARLESQLKAIQDAGDPLTLAELAPKPIPPEKNAAMYHRRAEADVNAMNDEIWVNDWYVKKSWDSGKPLPPEGFKLVKAALEAHPKVMPLLEQAAACQDYDPQLDFTVSPPELIAQFLPIVQYHRQYARVLSLRASLLVVEGNYDEAARSALLLLRLTRQSFRDTMLVGLLVQITMRGIAIEAANMALQSGPVSKEVRDALDAELALHESSKDYTRTIKNDRVYTLGFFRALPGHDCWFVTRGMWNQIVSENLDLMQEWIEQTQGKKPMKIGQGIEEKDSKLLHTFAYKLWGPNALLLPSVNAANHAAVRNKAQVRSLRVLIALQNHYPAGSNETPNLAQLGLSAETTTDPFDGQPLHVKKVPQGWLVYSLGGNQVDDGGKLLNVNNGDVGVGPPVSEGKLPKP